MGGHHSKPQFHPNGEIRQFIATITKACDTWEELADEVNKTYGLDYGVYTYAYWCTRRDLYLTTDAPFPPRPSRGANPEEVAWLKENAKNYGTWGTLTKAFNERFGLSRDYSTIIGRCQKLGIGPSNEFRARDARERRAHKLMSICETCRHAVPNHMIGQDPPPGEEPIGCSWSLADKDRYDPKPVEGWEATPGVTVAGSYTVHKCPLYREDDKRE